jgi:hypothetical protein
MKSFLRQTPKLSLGFPWMSGGKILLSLPVPIDLLSGRYYRQTVFNFSITLWINSFASVRFFITI